MVRYMDDVSAGHTRNLKRDRLLSEKERERLMDRKDKSKLALNDARVRKKLSNWLKTLDEVFLIFNNLPEEQSWSVITHEDAFKLLCLAARAMKIKNYYPIAGIVSDPYTWDIENYEPLDHKKCNALLYRAKFGDYIAPSKGGMGKLDKQLITIINTGAAMSMDELIKGLGIDPGDSEAIAVVYGEIKFLEAVGFIEKVGDRWQWTNPTDSKPKQEKILKKS